MDSRDTIPCGGSGARWTLVVEGEGWIVQACREKARAAVMEFLRQAQTQGIEERARSRGEAAPCEGCG